MADFVDPYSQLTRTTATGGRVSEAERRKLESLLRDGWRLTPATMAHRITRGTWIPARHLLHISTRVSSAVARGGARIIVTMPARHGKSEFLSVHTSAWHLELFPSKYVMNITYALDLATDFSHKVRTFFLDEDLHGLLRTRLRKDKLRVDRFLTTAGGGLTAAGIGGVITGRGADLMLVDDYTKNAESALSRTQRDATWEWFKSTAYTRLEPGASLIILATRWDVDDLIGRALTEMPGENWEIINLPALARPNDPLGREEGEALWPERYPREVLEKIKAAVGSYWWEAMYQQDPRSSMSGAELGAKLKVISESDIPHYSQMRYARLWDLAATEEGGVARGRSPDWTAGIKMGVHKESGKIYIPDILRFQKSPGGVELMVRACAEADGRSVQIYMEQEPGSAGKNVINHYKNRILRGYPFEGEKATGSPEIRASPFLAAVETGNVHIVRSEWNAEFISEINAFPDGDHDDQVAAASLGYFKLVGGPPAGLTWGRHVLRDAEVEASLRRRAKTRSQSASGRLIW